MENDNSVKRDLAFAGLGVVAFYAILILATVLDGWLGLSAVYNLVTIALAFLKVATASAITWVLLRVGFKNTIGKDFGKSFDIGWSSMSSVEKARWTIGAFVVLFFAIMLVV